jgi:hypothetical protein
MTFSGDARSRFGFGYQVPLLVQDHEDTNDNVLRLLANDPGIDSLDVLVDEDDMSDAKAQELGHAIGGSKYLQKLIISNRCGSSSPGLISVFLGLVQNRSIEHLVLKNFDHALLDIFAILSPFFMQNHNLRCIENENFHMSLGIPCLIMAARIPSLIIALMQSSTMERIDLSKGIRGDKLAAYLIRVWAICRT